jgi:NhaP-type Na+/H+ or K+/H+ antiporter
MYPVEKVVETKDITVFFMLDKDKEIKRDILMTSWRHKATVVLALINVSLFLFFGIIFPLHAWTETHPALLMALLSVYLVDMFIQFAKCLLKYKKKG